MENKIGDNLVPCGIPVNIEAVRDEAFPISTLKYLPIKYVLNQFNTEPSKPNVLRSRSKIVQQCAPSRRFLNDEIIVDKS